MAETVGANWFSYVALLAWPLVAVALYSSRPVSEATGWTVLGALLLLPSNVAIKIQMLPAIDKNSIASLSILLGFAFVGAYTKATLVAPKTTALLIGTYVFSPVVTSALNNSPVVAGVRIIPGVDYYDGMSALLSQSIFILPFFFGRRFLVRPDDTEGILRVLLLAGVIYTVPMLLEIRFSPQISQWVYGTRSAASIVEMRYGGFRPVVFMINGLAAAFFLSTAVLAGVTFWRTRSKLAGFSSAGAVGYLSIVLILCKSAGALVYAIVLGALSRVLQPKRQMAIAVFLSVIAVAYPVLRMYDLIPVDKFVEVAAAFNQERAASLKFRFDQEQQLLTHASDRFWFGWGRFGRSRVYDEYGNDISVTDGQWIVTFGQFGFLGFLAYFGLLTMPVFVAARTLAFVHSQREQMFLCCLALIVAVSAVEQLPNASISSWSWLLAGLLLGRCSGIRADLARKRLLVRRSMTSAPGGVAGQISHTPS